MKPGSNTPHDGAGSQQRNTPGGFGAEAAQKTKKRKSFARAFRFLNTKNPKIRKAT
jgi:hypothetical protein